MKTAHSSSAKNSQSQSSEKNYQVIVTDNGKWLFSASSDFLFAYLDDTWSSDIIAKVTNAFTAALTIPSKIKDAVKATSGEEVVKGLYLLNQASMVTAMNSIDGMGQTEVDSLTEQGSGTATSINQEFFNAILGGLGGDVSAMTTYLNDQMGDIQAQTSKSKVTDCFGTVIGLISLIPVLNVVETNFVYVYSSESTSDWFVKVTCGSHEEYSYDYTYTVVKYLYNPSQE
ncbi:hypothetical protein [Hymenobacter algoricola]|uniref:Uncharacterized protein n=1 Tax=Hymenobacter algoricola TaxID=486267 RepID=A0ABP7MYB2_9BACT